MKLVKMNDKEIKNQLMLSPKGDLAERLIMAYSTIAKMEEKMAVCKNCFHYKSFCGHMFCFVDKPDKNGNKKEFDTCEKFKKCHPKLKPTAEVCN